MLKALLRKARADIAGRPLQTGLVFLIIAAATAILAAAVTTQMSVDRAFMTRFDEGNGAHVWFSYPWHRPDRGDPSNLLAIGELPEVTGTTGLVPYVHKLPVLLGDGVVDLRLYGLSPTPPDVNRPILTRGRWLGPGGETEMVLDHGLARTQDIEIGDRLEVLGQQGPVTFEVVGLFVSAGLSYPHTYAESSPFAPAYVLPQVLEKMEPDQDEWGWRYGVRLRDGETASQFGRTVWKMYPETLSFTTWKSDRADLTESVSLYSVFIGLFGIFAVGVASFVIVSVVSGNLLTQIRDIGLLKSVGFTPGQVTLLILVEYIGVGLVAAVIGVAIGYAAAPLALRLTGDMLGTPASPVFDLLMMAAIVLGVTLVIGFTALVPSWRGGRISAVQALYTGLSMGKAGASSVARIAARLRLPVVVVVGLKDAFDRPVRSVLTILALVVAVIMGTFGLGMEATLRDITEDPRLAGGEPYELSVTPRQGDSMMSATEVRALLDSLQEVSSYYGGSGFVGDLVVEGQSITRRNKVFVAAPDEDYAALAPFVPKGRLFAEPGEAIVTRRLAEERGLGVGDSFTYLINGKLSKEMELDGRELDLRIVGIYIGDDLRVATSLDTLRRQLDADIDPTVYRIKVVSETDPDSLRVKLLMQANDRLSVTVSNDAEQVEQTAGYIRPPLYALTIALLAIGVVSVLITLLFTVHERVRELGVLKTIGFTPWQIAATVVTGSALMAGLALVVGIPLGIVFTRTSLNYVGTAAEVGTPFGTMPGPLAIMLLVPLILLVAVLGSALPARRAAGITVSESLRFG